MATSTTRMAAIGAGLPAGLAGLYFILLAGDRNPGSSRPDESLTHSTEPGSDLDARELHRGEMKPRPIDPANYIAAEHMTDSDRRAEFMLEADRSENLLAAVKAGEPHWQPTLIDMDFSDLALENYLKCSSSHLHQPCRYDIDYVVEVKEPGLGEIAFGRAVMDKLYAKDCEQYVKCMAKGSAGAPVVVAPNIDETFSHRKSQTDNYADATLNQLKEML